LQYKKGFYENYNLKYEVHYFLVKVVGGSKKIQDPDQLIYEIRGVSLDSLKTIELTGEHLLLQLSTNLSVKKVGEPGGI
jgi:hypothetical protein